MTKLSSMLAAAFVFSTIVSAGKAADVHVYMPATELEGQSTGPFFFIPDKGLLFSDGSILKADELGKTKDGEGFLFHLKNVDDFDQEIRKVFCEGEATHFIWMTDIIESELQVVSILDLLKSDEQLEPDQVVVRTSNSCGHLAYSLVNGEIEKGVLNKFLVQKGIIEDTSDPKKDGSIAAAFKDSNVVAGAREALQGSDDRKLITAILGTGNLDLLTAQERQTAEKRIIAYVKPLPASQAEDNRDGYAALARLDPENATYSTKAQRYADKIKDKRRSIVKRMKKNTDKFRGITFYHHPSEPRYSDTRSYVLPYVGEKEGTVAMRFVVHYTGDNWLFIQNAKFNIDGEIVPLRASKWDRDNDSEIWEWADLSDTPETRRLMVKIANSKETIIRFEGRTYYDNVTVRNSDKQAIKDMFLLEEVLKEGQ